MIAGRTLLDLFRPPPNVVGQTGLLSAFCATAGFLEDAVSVFSRLARKRRESQGQSFLFLLLDAHRTSDRIALLKPNEVPGVLELPPRAERHKELFHAKVALLQFGRARAGKPEILRLAVTTGNWTQASAVRQLELAWQVDVSVEDGVLAGPWADRADAFEAAEFFSAALERYAVAPALRDRIAPLLSLARSNPSDRRAPRFFHTLAPATKTGASGTSLYEQLVKRAPHDRAHPRDLLICGAGFYEKAGKKGSKPEVIAQLERMPGLKRGGRIALARPSDAGALAKWKATDDGWKVVGAVDRSREHRSASRSLHAKFIYVGRKWGSSARDGWLYLGSGNLTRRGLLLAPNTSARGNVEAGVVLDVPETLDPDELAEKLFVDIEADAFTTSDLKAGADEDDVLKKPLVKTPLVLLAEEVEDESGTRGLRLTWRDPDPSDLVTLRWSGFEIAVSPGTAFVPIEGACPSSITIHSEGTDFLIPVIDAAGALCRVPLSRVKFEDALSDILNFPVPPAEDEQDEDDDLDHADSGPVNGGDDDDPADDDPPSKKSARNDEEETTYPLQEGMELLERVAELQATMPNEYLIDWFNHLETRMLECFSPAQIQAWRDLEFPLLATLAQAAFQPPRMTPDQARAYFAMLRRIGSRWGMSL